MRRLSSSYNEDNISDEEIDEVYDGTLHSNAEIPLECRNHGERVLYNGSSPFDKTVNFLE